MCYSCCTIWFGIVSNSNSYCWIVTINELLLFCVLLVVLSHVLLDYCPYCHSTLPCSRSPARLNPLPALLLLINCTGFSYSLSVVMQTWPNKITRCALLFQTRRPARGRQTTGNARGCALCSLRLCASTAATTCRSSSQSCCRGECGGGVESLSTASTAASLARGFYAVTDVHQPPVLDAACQNKIISMNWQNLKKKKEMLEWRT